MGHPATRAWRLAARFVGWASAGGAIVSFINAHMLDTPMKLLAGMAAGYVQLRAAAFGWLPFAFPVAFQDAAILYLAIGFSNAAVALGQFPMDAPARAALRFGFHVLFWPVFAVAFLRLIQGLAARVRMDGWRGERGFWTAAFWRRLYDSNHRLAILWTANMLGILGFAATYLFWSAIAL